MEATPIDVFGFGIIFLLLFMVSNFSSKE